LAILISEVVAYQRSNWIIQ